MLDSEYMLAVESSIRSNVDVAMEGASKKALEIFSSERMKNVKDDMKRGIDLYNDGKYKKAIPILNKSIKELKEIRRDISSVQNFPLSSMLSPLYSIFSSIPKMFKAVNDPMLTVEFKNKLSSQASANVFLRLSSLIPYLGQVFVIYNEVNRLQQWTSNKKHAPEQIGSYLNDIRSDLLYLIDIYIDNAEKMLHQAAVNVTTNRATESIDRILDELF